MAINFVDGKYVDEKGFVKLDPTVYVFILSWICFCPSSVKIAAAPFWMM